MTKLHFGRGEEKRLSLHATLEAQLLFDINRTKLRRR